MEDALNLASVKGFVLGMLAALGQAMRQRQHADALAVAAILDALLHIEWGHGSVAHRSLRKSATRHVP